MENESNSLTETQSLFIKNAEAGNEEGVKILLRSANPELLLVIGKAASAARARGHNNIFKLLIDENSGLKLIKEFHHPDIEAAVFRQVAALPVLNFVINGQLANTKTKVPA